MSSQPLARGDLLWHLYVRSKLLKQKPIFKRLMLKPSTQNRLFKLNGSTGVGVTGPLSHMGPDTRPTAQGHLWGQV